ncbi:MAG: AAA family ATPase [Rhodocyclaceae bacterium]|nr:AAA family ATPase [Rhodocyclaceae bacterium]
MQCTADMLPADIIGVSIYDRNTGGFQFHPGPIFAQVILVDEINRATPKSQSALLEAMEEHQVTCEGETRLSTEPFFVIATQNPYHQIGTFPLPESQLRPIPGCASRWGIRIRQPSANSSRACDRRDMVASRIVNGARRTDRTSARRTGGPCFQCPDAYAAIAEHTVALLT